MSLSRPQPNKLVITLAIFCAIGALLAFLLRPTQHQTAPTVQETLRHDLVQNDGRWYRSGQTNPFTGCMVDYYPAGALLSRAQISNGLLNGLSESWFTNGQLQVQEHFQAGVSDGPREKWHENGAKLSQATIVQGKVTGTFRSWYDNGQLNEQIKMKAGLPDGVAWGYYPSGFLKAETTVAAGQILSQKVWKDGEHKAPLPP